MEAAIPELFICFVTLITLILEVMFKPFLGKWLKRKGLELKNFAIVPARVVGSF